MTERQIPELLKRDRAFFPFSYDHGRKLFLLGSHEVADSDPYEIKRTANLHYRTRISQETIESSPLIVDTLVKMIATPVLNDWIRKQDDLAGQVVPVMEEVFCRLAQGKFPDDILKDIVRRKSQKQHSGMFGFDARVSEYGWLRLQVWGECACMGVAFEEGYNCYEENMQLDYPELSLHNIDWEFQLGAIMAGLGHVATLAKE